MDKMAYLFGAKLAVADNLSEEEAKSLGEQIGINWAEVDFPVSEFRDGVGVEYEHGSKSGENTNVTHNDPKATAQIAWAHLKEIPDYYARLDKMEAEGKAAMGKEADDDDETTGKGNPISMPKIVDFLQRNPNPPDDVVHDFAKEKGYNIHSLEGYIYRLATEAAKSK